MRYKVTGGADGTSGIDVGQRRYEPGDVVEMTQAKAEWLIERGLLTPAGGKSAAAVAEVEDDDEPIEPEVDDLDEGDEV